MKLVEQGETDKKILKKVLGDFLCGTDKPYRILNMEYITIERCIFEITFSPLYLLSDELKTNYKVIKMSILLLAKKRKRIKWKKKTKWNETDLL